jgi:hypothetical protein
MQPITTTAVSANPTAQLVASGMSAFGAMMGGPDPQGGPSSAFGGPASNAFHADGWVVATGNAQARGGTVANSDAAQASAGADWIMPAALLAGAVVLAVALRR